MFEILLSLCLAGQPDQCRTERHQGAETRNACARSALDLVATLPPEAEAQSWPCVPMGTTPAFTLTEIAPGILVHKGQHAVASPANRGDLANLGVVIGDEAVAVIDAGGSAAVAVDFLKAIRHVTDLPVRWLILTHMHPDHVFGAGVFKDAGAEVIAHRKLPRALAARAETYQAANAGLIGPGFAGSAIILPDRTVEAPVELDLGNRIIELAPHSTMHTDNDLTVFDRLTGTLFLGDLLFLGHLPALDGSLAGWIDGLPLLQQRKAERAVPGHGPVAVAWPDGAEPMQRYLTGLAADTRAAINAGTPMLDAVPELGQRSTEGWLLVDEFAERNATAAFKELEWE